MVHVTVPAYLKDDFARLVASTSIENQLSFLDEKCLSKMTDCVDNPSNELFKKLWNIFSYDFRVICFASDMDEPVHSKDHFMETFRALEFNIGMYQQTLPFFTNPLKDRCRMNTGDDCIINADIYFHTFKCLSHPALDNKAFLNEQVSWLVGDDCIMAKIHAHLSRLYEDYRGLYCVYSGNKSVHIHTEWNIGHLRKAAKLHHRIDDNYLRPGLTKCWDIINREITAVIRRHRGIVVQFDSLLEVPDMYRRLSWGRRRVDDEGEFFAVGDKVPQVELYSQIRKPHLIYVSESRLHNAPIFKKYIREAERQALSFSDLVEQFEEIRQGI